MARFHVISICALVLVVVPTAQAGFVHPGCLSTRADMSRMAAKVAAGEQPWKGSWDILVRNTDSFMNDSPEVQETIRAGGRGGENYIRLARDCARTYQLALRYHGSGDKKFADHAVRIFNAWASGHKKFEGDTNVSLRKGIYGYQFACAAELLRDYAGWRRPDFQAFQKYMKDMYYSGNHDFLTKRHGTVPTHYWANWGLANEASMMAIGVLCDDRKIFDEALSFFCHGKGNESIENAVTFIHPDGLGQWQESGRDQGHSLMGPQLMGAICEIAWNQGVDLYGYGRNRFLASVEYVSKYNLGHDVPFVTYVYRHGHPDGRKSWVRPTISEAGRGQTRPGWDLIYNHYANRRGMSAPWTGAYAKKTRPEGGGFNFGGSSGGFDSLGFTTLTHSREPIANGALPGALRPCVEGRQVTLSWAGSAGAASYNVKRSTTKGGPYETIAIVRAPELYVVDAGLTAGATYHYVVSANHADGESADSAEATAIADGRLHGTVIGTDGSYQDSGAGRLTVFDGCLDNYFDPPSAGAWVGLDLGPGVSAVVTEVKYCPRLEAADRMVGGRFQGSNDPDFSSGVTDLFTIRTKPKDGVLTSRKINTPDAFRYFRYTAPEDGWCNVAEVEFLGDVDGLRPPPSPGGLTASPVDGTQVDLSWKAVPGAVSYQVKLATPENGPDLIVANVAGTGFRATGLTAGSSYQFVVSALNSAGESGNSAPVGVRTSDSNTGGTSQAESGG